MMTSELSSKDVSENESNGKKDPPLYTVKPHVGDILHDASIILLASVKILRIDFLSNSIKKCMVPETVENEYEVMYGNATNQLMFATDLMKFVRRFNHLKYVPVIYGINTKPVCLPASDRVKNVDLTHINWIWYEVKNEVEINYGLCCKSLEMNYQKFQVLTICIAQEIETGPYSNVSFLKNCVILCHLAACAEKERHPQGCLFCASYSVPYNVFLRSAGNFPEDIRIH